MQKWDHNYLLRVLPLHILQICARVEKHFPSKSARLGVLGLDVGHKHVGVSLFKPQSNELESITRFDRAKVDKEMTRLIKKHKVLCMVVNWPGGGGVQHHEHVTSFVDQLDQNEACKGIPFCYFPQTK